MFRSDTINDFNSGRFSSLIRPISVRTTSPFALRRILNTNRRMQSDSQRARMKKGHLCGLSMASSRQMSGSRQITMAVRSRWGSDGAFALGARAGTWHGNEKAAGGNIPWGCPGGRRSRSSLAETHLRTSVHCQSVREAVWICRRSFDILGYASIGGAGRSGLQLDVEWGWMCAEFPDGCHVGRLNFPPAS